MSPQNNNAYDKYLRVLSLDQDNKEAVRGIDTITDTYLQLVNTNIESGDLEKAQQYLEKADYLRPGQSKVISVQKALDEAIKKRDRAGSPFGKIKQIFR
jgi:tetratricopeptide (TPR) repeat protein